MQKSWRCLGGLDAVGGAVEVLTNGDCSIWGQFILMQTKQFCNHVYHEVNLPAK